MDESLKIKARRSLNEDISRERTPVGNQSVGLPLIKGMST